MYRKRMKVTKHHDLRCVRCYAVVDKNNMMSQYCPTCHRDLMDYAKSIEIMDSIDWGSVPLDES